MSMPAFLAMPFFCGIMTRNSTAKPALRRTIGRRKETCCADQKGTEMNKKSVLVIILALTMALCLTACRSGSGNNGNAGGDVSAASSDSSAAEDTADEEVSEEASKGDLTQEFEFTKSVMNQELEKPITVCGLKYDESEDLQFEDALNQERDSFHLHVSILEIGCDVDAQFKIKQSDNVDYVTSVARGHNVQQADAANSDGTAKFTVIRYTSFEDGGENDYKYMGVLVYTDGTNAAATEFMYSIDKEYGNGEEVEAALRAYLSQRKNITAAEGSENALFLSLQNKRITVRAVEKLVKKYAQTVTTLKKITPHKLRSTFGTNLYNETGDIYLVADVLGHKDVNTTKKHYAAQDQERLRRAANAVKLRETK